MDRGKHTTVRLKSCLTIQPFRQKAFSNSYSFIKLKSFIFNRRSYYIPPQTLSCVFDNVWSHFCSLKIELSHVKVIYHVPTWCVFIFAKVLFCIFHFYFIFLHFLPTIWIAKFSSFFHNLNAILQPRYVASNIDA